MKNYYIKVFLVALCALIFSSFFGVNSFAGFFLEDEYHNEPIPMSSLMNETSWDAMQGYVSDVWGVSFPTWTEASAVDDILEDIAMFYVGQTVSLSETVASNVANAILDSTSTVYDIWDMIAFDGDTGEFVRNPHYSDNDLTNVIHGAVDPLIYNKSGGFWYSLPYTIQGVTISNVSGNSYVGFYDEGGRYAYPVFVTVDSGAVINRSIGGNVSLTTPYTGTKTSGFCAYRSLGSYNKSGINCFSGNVSVALTDFFGDNPSMGESTLNGEGIIINENPDYKPVTAYSVLNYDYSTHIVNNYNTGDPVTWPVGVNTVRPYTYDYKGIYWDAPELETLSYPVEYEFPSLEFETIEVDQNVDNAIESLNGSWIVEFLLIAILLLIVGLIL